ncbi:MAG: cyclodeaminase/cyclohydrolase family protein [Planctomycetota bacterium]
MAWIECVPNVSEGRRKDVIRAIGESIVNVPGADLRSVHSDVDHNRTVYTIVGSPFSVREAAFRCVAAAQEHIDISDHDGVHPRFGAADVVPFIPLSGANLARCGTWARELAQRIESELEIPTYTYGAASENGETLPEVRRRADRAHPTAGAVAVGARDLLIAYNVMLDTTDLAVAKRIARAVREADGGLPAVRALGFALPSRQCVQVSMNLIDFRKSSPLRAYRRIRQLARDEKVEVIGSEVVGMIPREAVDRGLRAALKSNMLQVLDPEPSLLDRIAARTPTPAGGSAAAHTGALAAALVVMSCDLSRPTPRLRELRLKADRLRAQLGQLVEADARAYQEWSQSQEESALREATEIPVQIMERCAELWSIAAAATQHCEDKVSSDCSAGRRLAETARDIAADTARANLPLITDGTFRSKIARRLAAAFSG